MYNTKNYNENYSYNFNTIVLYSSSIKSYASAWNSPASSILYMLLSPI